MKTLFLLCTAVTILQVLDVSITRVSAASTPNSSRATRDPNAGKLGTTSALKKPIQTPNGTKPADDPVAGNNSGTNPNDDDLAEAEPPTTFKESGKRVVQTLKKMATNRGVGLLNGFTGFLTKSGDAFSFFGNFLLDRAKGVKNVAKESLGMVSGFSDRTTRVAKNLLDSGKVIGLQARKEMYESLQKATRLGKNLTKLGGTAVGTPLSISEDVVGTANRLAKVPSRVSNIINNGVIKPVLSRFGSNSSEEQPEEEEEKEDPPKAKVKTSTPSKPVSA